MPLKPTIALFALLLPLGASAQTVVPKLDQEGRKGDIARMVHDKAAAQFDTADGDKDNRLTREEVAQVSPHKGENFTQYDHDQDGYVTWEEFVGHDRWKK